MNDTKICPKCGIELDRSEFYKNTKTKDGFSCYCKQCWSVINGRRSSENKLRNADYQLRGVKVCTICKQELTLSMFGKCKSGKNGVRPYCLKCGCDYTKLWVHKYKDRKVETDRLYREKNKDNPVFIESRKISRKKWFYKNIELIHAKAKVNRPKLRESTLKREQGYRDNLTDRYVLTVLENSGWKTEYIKQYPEIIELNREIIKTKRLCKTLQNSENHC